MFAPTLRRGLAIVGATALAAIAAPLTLPFGASAAAGDPVVTLDTGTSGCEGALPTPGSGNTDKRLVSGSLEPGGTVTFQISYPVDAADVGKDFTITDCVFINGTAAVKYTVDFVPSNQNYLLSFNLVIPPLTPIGAEYCNVAKTTATPTAPQGSNRKAGPACFFVGGDLRIIKVATGDAAHTPLVGAAFTVVCTTNVETIPPVVISGLSGSTTFSTGAYRASGTAATGIIAIAGPEGTPCVVTETTPPAGYDLPANATFTYTIPAAVDGQEIDYIADPRTQNTTALVTVATGATVGAAIHDTATLSGGTTNPAVSGTITFTAFGPSDTAVCTGTPKFTSAPIPVSGNGPYNSGDFTPTAAGSYYWIASYSGDANNLPVAGACGATGETSLVGKQPTVIGTAASTSTVGDPIHDTATLSGGTTNPVVGGSITFRAWANASCTGDPAFTSAAIAVNGNGAYGSGDFAPAAAGSYNWIASYSGDANNLPVSGVCGDAGETSTVGKRTTVVGTDATSADLGGAISDTATLTGAGAVAGGTITFNLYGPTDTPDCSGPAIFTSTVAVTGSGDYHSGSFTPTTFGSYYWIAAYSGDENNLAASGACGDDGETSVVNALAVSPTPTHSPESHSTQPLAVTGAGPVGSQIGWALILLVLGGAVLLVGKRRGYRRTH